MELIDAIDYLKKMAKEYKTFGDLDNPEFEDTKKIYTSIDIVLKELGKLQEDNYKLDRENQLLLENQINSIPVSKIKDRIEQLEKEKEGNPDFSTIQAIIIDYQNMLED